MSRRDPYYKSPDGYDAYQWRELIKREIKNGKVYSTYKCSNLGGEVDIFTTEFPLDESSTLDERSTLDKIFDSIEEHWIWILFILIVSLIYLRIYLTISIAEQLSQ